MPKRLYLSVIPLVGYGLCWYIRVPGFPAFITSGVKYAVCTSII